MTQEVFEFEQRVAEFTGAKHCVSCGNGTDALMLGAVGARHRQGRRGHHHADFLCRLDGLDRPCRRDAGLCRRARRPEHRPGRNREEDHAAHQGDHAGALERPHRRHGRDHGHRAQAQAFRDRGRGAVHGRLLQRQARRHVRQYRHVLGTPAEKPQCRRRRWFSGDR